MSYSIKENGSITLTRGDTLEVVVKLYENSCDCECDSDQFVLEEGSSCRFAVKEDYDSTEVLINKDIPIDTMLLKLDPSDTKNLEFGTYVYDIQVTLPNGDVDTVLPRKLFRLAEEVE
jgi:hypothetical protein